MRPNKDQALAVAERRRQAMQLRLAGASYETIAERLGYSSRTMAWKGVQAALKYTLREPADELRKLELERLDRAQLAIWPQVVQGNQGAIDRYLRIAERRAKLLGLDAPVKSEWSGPDGGPIEVTDAREQLMALIARRAAGNGAGGGSDEAGPTDG